MDALFGNFSQKWYTTYDHECADVGDVKRFFKRFGQSTVHSTTVLKHVIDWGRVLWDLGMFRQVHGTGLDSSSPEGQQGGTHRREAALQGGWHTSREQEPRQLGYRVFASMYTRVAGASALSLRHRA